MITMYFHCVKRRQVVEARMKLEYMRRSGRVCWSILLHVTTLTPKDSKRVLMISIMICTRMILTGYKCLIGNRFQGYECWWSLLCYCCFFVPLAFKTGFLTHYCVVFLRTRSTCTGWNWLKILCPCRVDTFCSHRRPSYWLCLILRFEDDDNNKQLEHYEEYHQQPTTTDHTYSSS